MPRRMAARKTGESKFGCAKRQRDLLSRKSQPSFATFRLFTLLCFRTIDDLQSVRESVRSFRFPAVNLVCDTFTDFKNFACLLDRNA